MATDIDSLQIQINATATKANTTIDKLVGRLDKLSNSLQGLRTGNLSNLSTGVQQLGTAMQSMNAVKTADFTRLAKNLNNLATVDYSKISGLATSIERIGRSFSGLSGVSSGASQMADLAKAISQLGYKSATQAITNIPQLATAMRNLMNELSRAPRVSQNLIDMTNALAKLARTGASSGRAATSLSTAFDRIGNSSANAHKGISRVTLSLSGLLKKLLPIISLVKLFDLGKQSIEIASDLTEVQNVVDATFGNYKQKIEDLASVSIPELGMSELTAKQLGSRFQAIGTALGFSQGKMADMSVALTRLTGDMASFYNASQEDVGKALQSIFTGETEPMRRYGVDLTNATIQQWALNNGLNANISSMSQAEKAMLRYQYTMERTAVAQGDFARTSGTWANQVRILSENLKVLGSTIGVALINIFKPLITWLNKVMTVVISAVKTIVNALGAIFGWELDISASGVTYDDATSGLDGIASSADNAGSSMGGAADKAKELQKALLGFDRINKLPDESSSSGGSGGSGGGAGGGSESGVLAGITQTEGLLDKFTSNDSVSKWLDNIRKKAEPTTRAIKKLWDEGLSKLANFTWNSAKSFYENFLVPVGNWALGEGIPDLINATNDFLNNINWARISAALERFWKALAPFATSIGDGLIAFYEDLLSVGEKFINTVVPGGLDALSTVLEGMDADGIEKLGYALGVIATSIAAIKISTSLISKLKSLLSVFSVGNVVTSSAAGKASGGILAGLGAGAKWLGGKVSSAAGAVSNTSLFSSITSALGKFLPSAGGSVLPALFDEESRNYMIGQWKDVFSGNASSATVERWKKKQQEKLAKEKEYISSTFNGSGSETPELELEIIAKDKTKDGVGSAKREISTLPNETAIELDGNVKPLKKTYLKLQKEFGKGKNPLEAFLTVLPDGLSVQLQKMGKENPLEVSADIKTKSSELRNNLQTKVNAFNLMLGAKIGTSERALQSDATSKFNGYTAPIEATIATKPETLINGMQGALAGMALHLGATAEVKDVDNQLTKEQRTISAWAKFTKRILDLSVGERTVSGWIKYVNSQDGLSFKEKLINAVANYSSARFGDLSSQDRLVSVIGKVEELRKKDGLSLGLSAVISGAGKLLNAVFKENGGVFSGGSWKPITAYAGGGLPNQGQMFVAREAGPELVGTLGGHTAVINNNQIVSSVSEGVYHAVSAAMSQFTGQMNGGGTPNITVYVGGRQVTDVVVEEVNQRTRATGMCPIMV